MHFANFRAYRQRRISCEPPARVLRRRAFDHPSLSRIAAAKSLLFQTSRTARLMNKSTLYLNESTSTTPPRNNQLNMHIICALGAIKRSPISFSAAAGGTTFCARYSVVVVDARRRIYIKWDDARDVAQPPGQPSHRAANMMHTKSHPLHSSKTKIYIYTSHPIHAMSDGGALLDTNSIGIHRRRSSAPDLGNLDKTHPTFENERLGQRASQHHTQIDTWNQPTSRHFSHHFPSHTNTQPLKDNITTSDMFANARGVDLGWLHARVDRCGISTKPIAGCIENNAICI